MQQKIRLPLQVGTTSLWSLARASSTFVPGAVGVVAGVGYFLAGTGGWALITVPLGAYFVVYAAAHAVRSWRTRPSDALLDAAGMTLEGGAQHGLHLQWSEIDPQQTHAETTKETRITLVKIVADVIFLVLSTLADNPELAPPEKVAIRRLHVATRDGRRWRLAEAEHPDEQRSLDALLGSIQQKLGLTGATAPALPPEVLECAGCGAPVPPSESEQAACRYCGAWTPVPQALRARVRAHRSVQTSRHATAVAVAALLKQPGARRASLVLALAACVAAGTWAFLLFALAIAGVSDVGLFEVAVVLFTGMLASLVLFVAGRAALAKRRALRVLAASFGARAPRDARGSFACRRCGGPLPDARELVVPCAYCDTENILGLDLRSEVAPSVEHELSIQQVLAARRKEGRFWRLAALATLALVPVAGGTAYASFASASEHARYRDQCRANDAAACFQLATDYNLGIDVSKDEEKAAEYQRKACELGHAEACYDYSLSLGLGTGVMESPGQSRAARARSCTLGYAKACEPDE